jgi:hypothetical protein
MSNYAGLNAGYEWSRDGVNTVGDPGPCNAQGMAESSGTNWGFATSIRAVQPEISISAHSIGVCLRRRRTQVIPKGTQAGGYDAFLNSFSRTTRSYSS